MDFYYKTQHLRNLTQFCVECNVQVQLEVISNKTDWKKKREWTTELTWLHTHTHENECVLLIFDTDDILFTIRRIMHSHYTNYILFKAFLKNISLFFSADMNLLYFSWVCGATERPMMMMSALIYWFHLRVKMLWFFYASVLVSLRVLLTFWWDDQLGINELAVTEPIFQEAQQNR